MADLRKGIDRVLKKAQRPLVRGIEWTTPSGYKQALYDRDYESRADFEKEIEDFKRNKIDYEELYGDEMTPGKHSYQFPPLTEADLREAQRYGLKYEGKMREGNQFSSKGDTLLTGSKQSLKDFAKKYLGYELHPDYLYNEGDFDLDLLER